MKFHLSTHITRDMAALSIAGVALVLTACGGIEAAQKAYNLGEYKRAVGLYEAVQKKEKNKTLRGEQCFYIGECYRHLGMPSKAASAYMRAVRFEYDDDEAMLRLAECYRAMGKFDEADDAYVKYQAKHKTDKRIADGMASSVLGRENWAALSGKTKMDEDSGYVLTLAKEFNSKFSDYCPTFVGDSYDVVYFSSMRTEKKNRKPSRITGQGRSTLYMSRVDGQGKWTVPAPMEEPFGSSQFDDGVATVSADGSSMLFTRCPLNDTGEAPAQIFEMKREGGRWSDPVRVTPGGDSTMMVAHPALSPDGQTLYFVSDREEGSYGGKDIWKAQRNSDNSWGPAQNMGPLINSAGDEMFPYVRQDGTLYYSSNGLKGYGGLDIYKAVAQEGGLYTVSNMGLPINSAGDDFGIIFMGNAEEGLLSSNRGNAKGYDDIYNFCLPPVILTIEGHVLAKGGATRSAEEIEAEMRAEREEAARREAEEAAAAEAARAEEAAQAEAAQAEAMQAIAGTKNGTKTTAKNGKNTGKNTGKNGKSGTKTGSKNGSKTGAKSGSKTGTKSGTAAKSGTKTNNVTATTKPATKPANTTTAQNTTTKKNSGTSGKPKKKAEQTPVKGSFVRIIGSDGTNLKLTPTEKGIISFVAERDVHYIILSGAPGYANVRTELSTEGLNRTQTLSFTALLEKVEMKN